MADLPTFECGNGGRDDHRRRCRLQPSRRPIRRRPPTSPRWGKRRPTRSRRRWRRPTITTTWGSPLAFAANAGGVPHEGFGKTSTDNWTPGNVVTVSNDLFPYTQEPNIDHPSHPDYVEDTTMALSERGVDTSGEDASLRRRGVRGRGRGGRPGRPRGPR